LEVVEVATTTTTGVCGGIVRVRACARRRLVRKES